MCDGAAAEDPAGSQRATSPRVRESEREREKARAPVCLRGVRVSVCVHLSV